MSPHTQLLRARLRAALAPGWRLLAPLTAVASLALACGGDIESRMAEVRALQDVGQFTASIDALREILVIAPDLPEASYRMGVALVQTGERSRAIWSLQKAAESADYAIPAGSLLASIHLSNQDYDEALRVIDRVLELDPERHTALKQRANANIGAKNFEAALGDTQRLVDLFPDDYASRAMHAAALIDVGRLDDAEAAHNMLKELGAKSGDPELEVRGCIAPAIYAHEQLKDRAKASALYLDCVSRFPHHSFVLGQAAEYFDGIGRPERTMKIYRDAIEEAPENLGLRSNLANRLRDRGDVAGAEQVLVEAAETFDSAQAWNQLATFYRSTERHEKALAAIEKVIELSGGGSDQIRFTQADVLVDLGELERAAEVGESLKEPTYGDLIRGRILMAQGDPAGALEAFDRGIRNWPNNPAARYLAGVAARDSGDFERAVSELREAVRVDKKATEAALVLAKLHYDRGEYQQALAFANSYIANRPQGSRDQALRIATRSLIALRRWAPARRSLELLAALPGQELAATIERAHLDQREKGSQAAIETIRASGFDLSAEENEELLRVLASNHLDLGQPDQALVPVEAALAARPGSGSLHELRGTLLARARRTEEARREFARATELDSQNAAAFGGLATLTANAGETARAIELFDQAAELAPEKVHFAYAAAQLSLGAGDTDGAERRLRAIVARSPSHAGARNDLAWILSEKGEDLDLALALAKEASRLDPSANVLDTLGWVHLKRGEAASAVSVLESAAQKKPHSREILSHLAAALTEAGEADRARELLDDAMAAGAFPEVKAGKKQLEQL